MSGRSLGRCQGFCSQGYVGSDVTGVTVHTSSGLDIEASVAGNRFAAWWPSIQQSSDHPAETWSYTVHFADGSALDAPADVRHRVGARWSFLRPLATLPKHPPRPLIG